jgi:hypothetical protein
VTSQTIRRVPARRRARPPRRPVRWLAATLVLSALAACAGAPGSAAVVDGDPISEAALADAVAEWNTLAPATPAAVLQELIISPFIVDAAAAAGVGASEDDARALLEREAQAAGVDPASVDVGPGLLLVGRRFAAQEKASAAGRTQAVEDAAVQAIQEADIEVSPRYGTWDQVRITPLVRPWLVGTPASAP